MRTKVRRWGNSLGVRLPREVAQAARVRDGSDVELTVRGGSVVVRPVPVPRDQRFDLARLLRKVTRRNLHREADLGVPVGRELL